MDKVLYQKKNMGAKVMWVICDLFGFPFSILYIINNLSDVKSLLLSLVLIGYGCTRWYYYARQKEQAVREKEYDLWHREQDKKERQLTFDRANHKVNGN